jgi:hypothetical protein
MPNRLTTALRRIRQKHARAACKRRDRRAERNGWPQWFLLVGRDTTGTPETLDPASLTPILPPPDRFWADPFLWRRDGQVYVFLEEYLRAGGGGRISLLQLGPDLQPIGPAVPIIEEDRHLSYPFLFEYRGELYMVPESARSRRVDLYRCERFPDQWTRQHSLLTDIEAADATLFEHEGRWWLFCAARVGRTRINESLFAFHADSPLSERWIPHPGNPLIRDFSRGRPGGRVMSDGAGRLIRPSQDCVPRYGYGLGLNVIEMLNPEQFSEHRIWHATGASVGGWRAMHHLDRHQGLLIMDAQQLLGPAETRVGRQQVADTGAEGARK